MLLWGRALPALDPTALGLNPTAVPVKVADLGQRGKSPFGPVGHGSPVVRRQQQPLPTMREARQVTRGLWRGQKQG